MKKNNKLKNIYEEIDEVNEDIENEYYYIYHNY